MTALAFRHPRVQRLRRLTARRSVRVEEGRFVAEGIKVVSEALSAGAPIEALYVEVDRPAPGLDDLVARSLAAGHRVFDVEAGVLARVGDTVTPQPVVAVVAMDDVDLAALGARTPGLVLVCVDVRDPGNAGSILRSAAAAGADGVVFCAGSVDVHNPKTVRASAGAIFHIPVVTAGEPGAVLADLAGWGLTRWGTTGTGGRDYVSVDLRPPTALVLGNEANGLPPHIAGALDGLLTIPLAQASESLNVGMAAAVLAFEVARQRRVPPSRMP